MSNLSFCFADEQRIIVQHDYTPTSRYDPVRSLWSNSSAAKHCTVVKNALEQVARLLYKSGAPVWILHSFVVVDAATSLQFRLHFHRNVPSKCSAQQRDDFMKLEYEQIGSLIVHWDEHSWQKSNFFFAVETVMLCGMGVAFQNHYVGGVHTNPGGMALFTCVAVFNMWLCYVWYRTSRSNRSYLAPLFSRARHIEYLLADNRGTFAEQLIALQNYDKRRQGSSQYEIHIPTTFWFAWLIAWGQMVWTQVECSSFEKSKMEWLLSSFVMLAYVVVLLYCELRGRVRSPEPGDAVSHVEIGIQLNASVD